MKVSLFRLYLIALSLLTAGLTAPWLVPYPADGPRLHALLADVPTTPQRHRVLGYDRAAFGTWAPVNGCTTREQAVTAVTGVQPVACAFPPETVGTDPYSGLALPVGDIEVDHVVPLSAAWDLGAHAWTDAQRHAFANDPDNLVATSRALNQAKSDQLASGWLPPGRRARCEYVRAQANVVKNYGLALPAKEKRIMRRQCAIWG